MLPYATPNLTELKGPKGPILSFVSENDANFDPETVKSFGEEWTKFSAFSAQEIKEVGDEYFDIVPEGLLTQQTIAMDLGCGSGRWSRYLLEKVGFVEGVDPSEAVYVAQQMNADTGKFRVTHAGVDSIPFADNSFDFIICLGVLHHVPGTAEALAKAVKKLKPGGHFLLYLYYSLDNRGPLYRALFGLVNIIRRGVANLPGGAKRVVCDLLAIFVYMPLVLLARVFRGIGLSGLAAKIPLDYYHNKSWNIIRNDALDRFGTPLEQRFSRKEITEMMQKAGLKDIVFSEQAPFWHSLGKKA
jgi:SAM-dependent methyltransferase